MTHHVTHYEYMATYNKCDLLMIKLSGVLDPYWTNLLCYEKLFLKFLWCS